MIALISRLAIISPPPPTTSHNFVHTTHDHTQPVIISPPPLTTSHNHPRPTIIKSSLPTNNDSLATTFLTSINSELCFWHHYLYLGEFQEQSIFNHHYPPNTNIFSFSESEQFSLTIYVLPMPLKTKIKKTILFSEGNFFCRLIF